MPCCHADFAAVEGSDRGFTVGMPTFTFGPGVLAEAGDNARELGVRRVALFTDPRLQSGEYVAAVKASLERGRRRLRRLQRRLDRADRRVVPGRGALRRRRPVRRLRFGGRRLGDGHVQGGEPLRVATRRFHVLRERADRRRAEGAGAGEAAHRVPDDIGHGLGDHGHRDLQSALAQREDRHHLAAADSRHRADRSDGHRHVAEERRRRDRLRLHEPRARGADGTRVSAAAQSGEGRAPTGVAGRESVFGHARDRGVARRRQDSWCARSTTRRTPRRARR